MSLAMQQRNSVKARPRRFLVIRMMTVLRGSPPRDRRWEPTVSTDPASELDESGDMRTAHLAGYSAAVVLLS